MADETVAEPAPPTDEELARLERNAIGPSSSHDEAHCDWCKEPHFRAVRLIAALRASRAEVERLRAVLQDKEEWERDGE